MVEGLKKRVCRELNQEKWFDNGIQWKIGIGDKVRFEVDTWADGNCWQTCFQGYF